MDTGGWFNIEGERKFRTAVMVSKPVESSRAPTSPLGRKVLQKINKK
jgi:hypothetical protein